MESGLRAAIASSASLSASSSVSAATSTYAVSRRRSMRCGSTSTQSATPPAMVTASGCAPPMPPRPAVRTSLPARSAP